MTDNTITARGLIKRYGDVTAVAGIDLDVKAGACLGLLGPNGAGKTTTTEMLVGLTRPDAGSITVLGKSWERDAAAIREQIGVQLQETIFGDKLTVLEIVQLFRSFYRDGRTVDEVIDTVGLGAKRNARYHQLSGGQKARVGIARAVALRPKLLILDEPTAALDVSVQAVVLALLARLRSELSMSYIFVSHDLNVVRLLCDRVIVMQRGRIVEEGPAETLLDSPSDPYTRSLVAAIPHLSQPAA